ncbi:hypothetical protein FQZ97_1067470 [compost metagenome]
MVLEDAVLLGLRKAREQRQHLGVAQRGNVAQVLAQMIGGFADLTFTGQENQDVATLRRAPQLVHSIGDGVVEIVVATFLKRPVTHLHRKGAAGHHEHRRRALL